jgi:putative membrane protein
MIQYDPNQWRRILFAWRGTVLPQIWRRVLGYTLFAAVLWVWHAGVRTWPNVDPLVHSLLAAALGLLIVFRTNTAYDRYWEGRKLWGGIITGARNLVRGASASGTDAAGLGQLVRVFVVASWQYLHDSRDYDALRPLLSRERFEQLTGAERPPVVAAYFLSAWIQKQLAKERLDVSTGRMLESFVCGLVENLSGCERIRTTPIPFSYAASIKQLLTVYLLTLPFVLLPRMDGLGVLAMTLITFGLISIEQAGLDIENPFGDDDNDLPLEEFCTMIGEDTGRLASLSPAAPVAEETAGKRRRAA